MVGAYQNIAKNSPTLVRGNNASFDALLTWAATIADVEDVEAAYRIVAARVAATARNVEARPDLRLARLTFARVSGLLESMLDEPSGGAHEQFILAALLEAVLTQEGSNRRVETKRITATDKSSRTAGDVEVWERGKLYEGIEISANPWQEKVPQAEQTIREHGLPRAHVIAAVSDPHLPRQLADLTNDDISVLDVRAAAATLTAVLDRRSREVALIRLYELLDEKLATADLVNAYVARLRAQGLVADLD